MVGIPLILISGGLGSGKTTFVRRVIGANPTIRFGVVVNEFGEVGIDGDLLRPTVPQIVEIRNGCICCATQDQLIPAVKEVLSRYVIDVLLVEMSGAADPVPATRILAVLEPMVALRKHVALIDATAEARTTTRDHSLRNSLATADLAVLTKTDIASPRQAHMWKEFLRGFASTVLVMEAVRGDIPLTALLAPVEREKARRAASAFQHRTHRLASICHFIDRARSVDLQLFAARYGSQVERFKGILRVDGAMMEVHGVRGRVDLLPCLQSATRGRLVFISSRIDQAALQAAVVECLGPGNDPQPRAPVRTMRSAAAD
jgi:G3E family GTPase